MRRKVESGKRMEREMPRGLAIGLVAVALLGAGVACRSAARVERTDEFGALVRPARRQAEEKPTWRLAMPVVHRNRRPKAATWPAAFEALFGAAPETLAAVNTSGTAVAAFGLAEVLGTWVVPDLSSTQNIVLEFGGLATEVTLRGIRQEESADGRVVATVEELRVKASE